MVSLFLFTTVVVSLLTTDSSVALMCDSISSEAQEDSEHTKTD